MTTKAQQYQSRLSQQKKFKVSSHSFDKRIFHWLYCSGCGLVNLKNEQTRKRISQSCESMED